MQMMCTMLQLQTIH